MAKLLSNKGSRAQTARRERERDAAVAARQIKFDALKRDPEKR
jgi:hypothetical protein